MNSATGKYLYSLAQPHSISTLSRTPDLSQHSTVPDSFFLMLFTLGYCLQYPCMHPHDDREPSRPSMASSPILASFLDSLSIVSCSFLFFASTSLLSLWASIIQPAISSVEPFRVHPASLFDADPLQNASSCCSSLRISSASSGDKKCHLFFVHRFSLSQKVLSENLDFLVSHFQCFFPYSEALLQFRQSCSFRLLIQFCLASMCFAVFFGPLSFFWSFSSSFSRTFLPAKIGSSSPIPASVFSKTSIFPELTTAGYPRRRSRHSHSVCNLYDSSRFQCRTSGRTTRHRSVLPTFHPSCHVDVHTSCHLIHTHHIQEDRTMRTSEQKQNKGLDTESRVQQVLAKPLSLTLSLSLSRATLHLSHHLS